MIAAAPELGLTGWLVAKDDKARLVERGDPLPRAWRERSPLNRETVRYLRRIHACQGPGKRLRWSLRPLAPPPPSGVQPLTGQVSR